MENDSTSSSLGFDIHSAVKSLPPIRLGNDETLRPQSLSTLSATKGKLQHNLSSEIGLLSAAHCLSSAPHRRDAARLRSAQGRGSGAWLEALPSSDRYALITKDFRLASYLRLSLPMPFKSCINKCECGVELYGTGYHLLTCKFGGGPVWQHDSVVSGWCSCLNELQLHHRKEPRDQYTESENRPNILMYNETSTELDVSMAHPWSKDILNRASKEAGYAAERHEMRKKSKYEALSVQDGTTPNLVPLVFEHFGFWGQEADNFLNSLSKKSRDSEGRSTEADFRTRWRRQISIIIQRCNARVILIKEDK